MTASAPRPAPAPPPKGAASPLAASREREMPAERVADRARRLAIDYADGQPLPLAPPPAEGEPETPDAPRPDERPPERLCSVVEAKDEPLPAPLEVEGAPPPPPLAARTRLKLKLWRLKTEMSVELYADSGDLMAWRDPRRAFERGHTPAGEWPARETAKAALPLPPDCGWADCVLRTSGDVPSYEVSWVHLVGPDGDVVVEGDKILVRVNQTTGRVHSVFQKWRSVPETPPAEPPEPPPPAPAPEPPTPPVPEPPPQ